VEPTEASPEEGLDDGGCGKEPILMVFLSVLPGVGVAPLVEGRLEVDICFALLPPGSAERVGRADEAERDEVNGAGSRETADPRRGSEGVTGAASELCLALGTGSEGNGVFGGPYDGRDGRGSVVAIMLCDGGCDSPLGSRPDCLYGVCCASDAFLAQADSRSGAWNKQFRW
jgi:hypothetical protein